MQEPGRNNSVLSAGFYSLSTPDNNNISSYRNKRQVMTWMGFAGVKGSHTIMQYVIAGLPIANSGCPSNEWKKDKSKQISHQSFSCNGITIKSSCTCHKYCIMGYKRVHTAHKLSPPLFHYKLQKQNFGNLQIRSITKQGTLTALKVKSNIQTFQGCHHKVLTSTKNTMTSFSSVSWLLITIPANHCSCDCQEWAKQNTIFSMLNELTNEFSLFQI